METSCGNPLSKNSMTSFEFFPRTASKNHDARNAPSEKRQKNNLKKRAAVFAAESGASRRAGGGTQRGCSSLFPKRRNPQREFYTSCKTSNQM
eukprot:321639-Amphidinium_carterae.1